MRGFLVFGLILSSNLALAKMQKATFAGGCFWCMEKPFEKIDGVSSVVSGYIGGNVDKPSYEQVSSGKTGHLEAVEISYDDSKVQYDKLLKVFWRNVNPTDAGGQFVDRGGQYATGIFFHNEKQKTLALASKERLEGLNIYEKKIVTPIIKATTFFKAEKYHQDYYKKNPLRYKYYRYRSGRDQYLEKIWTKDNIAKLEGKLEGKKAPKYSKPSDAEIKKKLNALQFKVTQEEGTERPFKNKYWDNKKAGIYVDIVSGEPLFSSKDKFKSGTGWPSFTKPLVKSHVVEKEDNSLFMKRVEVRSKYGDSHLGHVFDDGPAPTGLRYCINSASLEFIPVAELEKRGYKEYLSSFEK